MDQPIGVFDSGMGGLSVLGEMRRLLPRERFIFYGDNANAPYGTRREQEIVSLTCAAVDKLLTRGIKALVLACNTATSAAAPTLRTSLSVPVVGMEPALKPAQSMRRDGHILVMATPATLCLPKFDALMSRYGQGAVPVPIRGLVELIQAGKTAGPQVEACLRDNLAPYMEDTVDAAVLGCTHYIFAKGAIRDVLGPRVQLVDGNAGTARQLYRILERDNLLRAEGEGGAELTTSGDPAIYLPLMRQLYALAKG